MSLYIICSRTRNAQLRRGTISVQVVRVDGRNIPRLARLRLLKGVDEREGRKDDKSKSVEGISRAGWRKSGAGVNIVVDLLILIVSHVNM